MLLVDIDYKTINFQACLEFPPSIQFSRNAQFHSPSLFKILNHSSIFYMYANMDLFTTKSKLLTKLSSLSSIKWGRKGRTVNISGWIASDGMVIPVTEADIRRSFTIWTRWCIWLHSENLYRPIARSFADNCNISLLKTKVHTCLKKGIQEE